MDERNRSRGVLGGIQVKFQDFIEHGLVRKASPDSALVKSLLFTAEEDLKFLESLEITSTSSRKIMSNYYDTLRSILEAIALLEGYKIYSHEAFAYFLKEKGQEILAKKFDRFREIRNKINYYGKVISVEEAKEYSEEIKKMILLLKKTYLQKKI